ncbi:MAG: hypothetical protein DKT66_08310 [Candidatus Melainabacteria bacterium]|nr:MAG: hypothetical protein DKT66_08310 [Candidatus Melainabacteria bacterium]
MQDCTEDVAGKSSIPGALTVLILSALLRRQNAVVVIGAWIVVVAELVRPLLDPVYIDPGIVNAISHRVADVDCIADNQLSGRNEENGNE